MRELHKLDDLDPDNAGYITALNSELESLRSMNVYNSSDLLNIDSVPQHKVGSSKLIFSKIRNFTLMVLLTNLNAV